MSALSEAAGLLKTRLDLFHRCWWENGISTVPGTQNSQGEQQKEAWEKTVHNYCKVPCSDCRQTTGCA